MYPNCLCMHICIDICLSGKHVFVVQTCAAPVNDSIMELLFTITAARRSGAPSQYSAYSPAASLTLLINVYACPEQVLRG